MKKILKKLYFEGIKAVDPETLMEKNFPLFWDFFYKKKRKKVVLISFGKASLNMAKGAIKELRDYFSNGIILTNQIPSEKNFYSISIKIFTGGHPIPDENSLKGTEEVLKLIEREKKDSIFFILISGGGSALLSAPKDGIKFKDKIKTVEILLKAGANISDLNCVRKHLSKVKGGNLAKFIYPAPAISFIISDVLGDKLDVIASGPTYPDSTKFEDALKIIEKYKIKDEVPKNILNFLISGKGAKIEENPQKGDKIFKNIKNFIIGNNEIALKEIKRKAEKMGIEAKIFSKDLRGEAREAGKKLAKIAIEEKEKKKSEEPLLLISGGETTVKVKGKGKGGRAQELALSFAKNIKDREGIYLLSAGSDGRDGMTDAAGAIVDGNTVKKGEKFGLDADRYLNNNDSYNFLKRTDSLFITGPTGTNVMDFYLILLK